MTSPEPAEDEAIPTTPKTPTKPRRAPAVKRTPNARPNRQVSAGKAGTPNSATPKAKVGGRKAEPTLLGDFLLGRPSPGRKKRKSLDVVKAEMKEATVNKLQSPGGVKDRVKQWQKASAAASTDGVDLALDNSIDILVAEAEAAVSGDAEVMKDNNESDANQEEPIIAKNRKPPGPAHGVGKKAVNAPKKRVVSDDHWMAKKKSSPTTKQKKSPIITGGNTLPKDFLQKAALNPPLEKKMADWTLRNSLSQLPSGVKVRKTTPKSRRVSKDTVPRQSGIKDPIVIAKSAEDDTSSKSSSSTTSGFDADKKSDTDNDGTRARAIGKGRGLSRKKISTPSPSRPTAASLRSNSESGDSDADKLVTRSHNSKPRRSLRNRQPRSKGEDIVESSSTIDIPVGAEAGNMTRDKPQRHSSFSAVPKVLKKVFNDGIKLGQERAEPLRLGINQPPSIESWLDATSDPFVDRPDVPESVVSSARPTANGRGSSTNTIGSRSISSDQMLKQDVPKQHSSPSTSANERAMNENRASSRIDDEMNENLTQGDIKPLASPSRLKRTPATRAPTAPARSSRKSTPIREVIIDAFRGESEVYGSRSTGERSRYEAPKIIVDKIRSRADSDDDLRANATPVRDSRRRSSPNESVHSGSERQSTSEKDFASRRTPPTTGQHRLSTIASVETFTNQAAKSIAEPELKASSKSVNDNTSLTELSNSSINRKRSGKSSLKRRLTTHSDLISVLSLPETANTGQGQSLKSARSIRTTRSRLDSATIPDLLKELSSDEAKYLRELETLVDGVIPVLLRSFLSGNGSATLTGLFDSQRTSGDTSLTKHIVDMGTALERLKHAHRRIPINEPSRLLVWASDAYPIYEAYVRVWRLGFQDMAVNLAPALRPTSSDGKNVQDDVAHTPGDDVLNKDSARVDVTFLLKRPLVRIKYLARLTKGIDSIQPSGTTRALAQQYQDLLENARHRIKEETARLMDEAANKIDPTKARDPRTLAPMNDVKVNQTRQVNAKDFFDLHLEHSSGQKIDCRVELLVRDKPSDSSDSGDVMICEVDTSDRWLLLPPVALNRISARRGTTAEQVIVLIWGEHESINWQETLKLIAEDEQTASEWIQLMGESPVPPLVADQSFNVVAKTISLSLPGTEKRSDLRTVAASSIQANGPDIEVPIGESLPLNENLPAKQTSNRNEELKNPVLATRDKLPSRYRPTKPKVVLEEAPPSLPEHRIPVGKNIDKAPLLEVPVTKSKNRRSSSPLKHEYQPSDASGTSSSSETSDSDDYSSSEDDSSDEDELEVEDANYGKVRSRGLSPSVSTLSLPIASLVPSNSASQGPYRSVPPQSDANSVKLVATISSWSNSKGRWDELHPEDCSIVVSAGLIEAFALDAGHSKKSDAARRESEATSNADKDRDESGVSQPLIALELTPLVPLRQSNALDIEIRSPPTSRSTLKCTGVIRYRSRSLEDCRALYAAIHRARLDNPTYKRLEQERMLAGYGGHSYESAVNGNRRRTSWFGRRNSYRASARAPSESPSNKESESSSNTFSSAFSALRRMSGGGSFSIANSSVDYSHASGQTATSSSFSSATTSLYTSSSDSTSSGLTPPRTPTSPSLTGTSASNAEAAAAALGSSNLKVRLYVLETSSKWADLGAARVTVTQPPPGMRQASSLYHGIERRVIVSSRQAADADQSKRGSAGNGVLLDVVLGGGCFSRVGVVGIAINVWEEITGPNGEVGRVAAVGGVSGKTRKWMFQCKSAAEARWIFALVGGGGR